MRVAAREDWRDRRSVAFVRATGEREPSSEWLDTTRTVPREWRPHHRDRAVSRYALLHESLAGNQTESNCCAHPYWCRTAARRGTPRSHGTIGNAGKERDP